MKDTPGKPAPVTGATLDEKIKNAKTQLDAQVREVVRWHFSPDTGTPFWLEKAKSFNFNPLKDVNGCDDIKKFPFFEDDWLRGGPVQPLDPEGLRRTSRGTSSRPAARPASPRAASSSTTSASTTRCSRTRLPDKFFPKGSNWLMLGPSGPRRLRLAVEHLCQYRGGICFCIDLDPRWVVKLIKKGWMEHLKAYQEHCIDQAMTILSAGHDIKCMFTTPKLLDALCKRLETGGLEHRARPGITGIFCGGTEMTSQWIRFAIEEYLGPDVYIAPTYGNTLMGLAASEMPTAEGRSYKIAYYAPQPRAVAEVVDFKDYDKLVPVRQHGPRAADDADEGVLRAAVRGARRGRARAAEREVPVGRRQRRAAVPRDRGDDDGRGVLR